MCWSDKEVLDLSVGSRAEGSHLGGKKKKDIAYGFDFKFFSFHFFRVLHKLLYS